MSGAKRIVLLAAAVLFAIWLTVHWGRVTGDANALIRFTLGVLFAVLVILRGKPVDEGRRIPNGVFPVTLTAGVLAALVGIIFRVHMLEWAGVLLLLFACGFWVAAPYFRKDLVLAFTVLFWVHPLPGQFFGWMQGMMQRLSVIGSEIILHTLNVRVWGDGIVLRAGYQNFLVPEACSGMRTSVTVFLCALGVGLLLRLRWWETLGFIVLGLAQVLALNIARISYMVIWAPRMPPEWAENFLHDSLGAFLLGAILLIQVEAGWWRWWTRRRQFIREGIRNKELEGPDKASIIPLPLRRLMMALVVMGGVGLIGFGLFVVAYKNRAYHRKEMIREVAEGLMATDPNSAYRAFSKTLQWFPEDRQLLSLQANTEFVRGGFAEGLDLLERIESGGTALDLPEQIMKAWALTRTGQDGEARRLIRMLPPQNDRIPGVAMLKAEFAAVDGRPSEVAAYLPTAAVSHLMLPRVRALFPFMAHHEQWQAIVASDHDRPYADLGHALISLHAHQQVNHLSGLVRVMQRALENWPDDPRLLRPLSEIAAQRRGGDWEAHFESNLKSNVERLSPAMLSMAAKLCWRLQRPDLAWLVYIHMQRHVPGDPELVIAPARYGQVWTWARRRQLSVQADTEDRMLDLLPVLNLFSQTRPFADFRRRIPMLDEVASVNTRRAADRQYERGLAALDALESEGALEVRHMQLYPYILSRLNRFPEAHERLDKMRDQFPELAAEVALQHATFYDRERHWQKSYEMLERYRDLQRLPNQSAELLRVSALMNLNLAVCALQVLEDVREYFPDSGRLDMAETAIWDVFGYQDQALQILSRTEAGATSPVAAALLYATGRVSEAQRLSTAYGFIVPEGLRRDDPPLRLPPANLTLSPRWLPPPEQAELDRRIEAYTKAMEDAHSPFIRSLNMLMLDWVRRLRQDGYAVPDAAQDSQSVERWEAIGRTPLEKTGALYELAMLAARQRDEALSKKALRRLLEISPSNTAAWRSLVSMSAEDRETVHQAALHRPHDPEIFLAELVVLTDPPVDEARLAQIQERINRALTSRAFSPGTLVRAGDLLLERGQLPLAEQLARAAVTRAEGMLAAHVLANRTALTLGNADWALASTLRGIELARDPTPFYRIMVELITARRQVDSDLLSALEYLRSNQREETRWAETLGALYFQRGNLQRAMTIFGSVMTEDNSTLQLGSLLLASEAARLNARQHQAIRILEDAYLRHPEEVGVLNNLVYSLAQMPATLPRARRLLPRLLELGGERFEVMDTVAMVFLRSGDIAQAQQWMNKALANLQEGGYAVHEVRLNAAELKMQTGQIQEAREILEQLRRDPARPDYVDQRARRLLRDIDEGGRR